MEISTQVTNGLVETLGCAFARIWLVTPDRQALSLIASAGLYTRLDGSFSRVPMGHFKIGKIAQNCIPFLSNCLAEEAWVKDREWAIANNIQGFAGLPLMQEERAIGVLAIFSTTPMNPGLLEVLQLLSSSIAGALSSALKHQKAMKDVAREQAASSLASNRLAMSLSEQLGVLLGKQKLSLLGTEQSLTPPACQLLLKLAEYLADFSYRYCRLVYENDSVAFETTLAVKENKDTLLFDPSLEVFATLAQSLGGTLSVRSDDPQTVISVRLQLPYELPSRLPFRLNGSARRGSARRLGSPLSEREHEVMQLMAEGLRDRDIADRLYISVRTVKFHSKNILTKLNVNTRMQSIFEATKKGWLS